MTASSISIYDAIYDYDSLVVSYGTLDSIKLSQKTPTKKKVQSGKTQFPYQLFFVVRLQKQVNFAIQMLCCEIEAAQEMVLTLSTTDYLASQQNQNQPTKRKPTKLYGFSSRVLCCFFFGAQGERKERNCTLNIETIETTNTTASKQARNQ